MRKLFFISLLISSVSIGNLIARERCGEDYSDIALPKLVGIYRESYVVANFKLINQDIKNTNAVLRLTLLKKGSTYQEGLEFKFTTSSSGSINACGTEFSVKEPSQYVASERNAYLSDFASATTKASKNIEKAITNERK